MVIGDKYLDYGIGWDIYVCLHQLYFVSMCMDGERERGGGGGQE